MVGWSSTRMVSTSIAFALVVGRLIPYFHPEVRACAVKVFLKTVHPAIFKAPAARPEYSVIHSPSFTPSLLSQCHSASSITVSSSLSTLPSRYRLLAPADSQSTSVIEQALQQSISIQHCPCLHLLKRRSVMAIMTVYQSYPKDHWSRRRRKGNHLNTWMISEDIGGW